MVQWVRESDIYEIISKLGIFKSFRLWKSFKNWRTFIRSGRFKENRKRLENSLFLLNPIFSRALTQTVTACLTELREIETFPLRPQVNYTLNEFIQSFGSGPSSHKKVLKQALTQFIERVILK
jgi:dynein heavy chain